MKIKYLLKVLGVYLFSNAMLFSQTYPDFVCDSLTLGSGVPEALTGGRFKPSSNQSGEYFRALFVFVQFEGDTNPDAGWPVDSLPVWVDDFIDSTVSSNYRNLTFSDYWADMSMDSFDFIGDIYPELVVLPPDTTYSQNNKNYRDCNEDVLAEIDGNVDFSLYDNWKLESGQFRFSESGADSLVDMIYIIYRNPSDWFGSFSAKAHLGFSSNYITNDTTSGGNTVRINGSFGSSGSGITVRQGLRGHYDLIERCAHEYGHYLFGFGHSNYGGIMGAHTYALNGWERIELGYITPTIPSNDGDTVTLGDFIRDGDIIKIPVPFSSPSSSTYFLVENHQRESPYDQIMRGGSIEGAHNFTTTLGSGIYIWLITGGNSFPCGVNPKTADGSWDWVLNGTINMPAGWPSVMPLTKRDNINRDTGKSDRHPFNILWSGEEWEKWHDKNPFTHQYELTRDVMGDEYDAFNLDDNELFTPWSNPSSYSSGVTNISVELLSQSANDITLKIYSTYASALSLPPSKPQNLSVTYNEDSEVVLNWDANIEPDVIYGGQYKIYRAEVWGTGDPTSWSLAATITAYPRPSTAVTSWTDTESVVYTGPRWLHYKIACVDSTSKESVPSYPAKINAKLPKENLGKGPSSLDYEYELTQNYPNPFNPTTSISYTLKEDGFVKLKVFDLLGQEVSVLVNSLESKGRHSVEFGNESIPSGIYIYTLRVNDFVQTRKMMLLK